MSQDTGVYRLMSTKKSLAQIKNDARRRPVVCCVPGCDEVSRFTAAPEAMEKTKYWCPKHVNRRKE